jgi:CheY-like chemotaxis protein
VWLLLLASVSRGIVKSHGGDTGLYSPGEGAGSNFFFTLPLYYATCATCPVATEEGEVKDTVKGGAASKEETIEKQGKHGSLGAAEEAAAASKLTVFRGLRVLVVDDSTMVRKMLVKRLLKLGCEVDEAGDGQEAIDTMQEKFDLVSQEQEQQGGEGSPKRASLSADDASQHQHLVEEAHTEEQEEEPLLLPEPPPMPYDLVMMDSVMPRVSGLTATQTIRHMGFHGLIVGVTGNVLPEDITGN